VLQHLQATAAPDQTRPILDSAAEKGSVIIGIASIIDGDTIEIHGHRIRLFGVDAPESRQLCSLHGRKYRCGQKAAFGPIDGTNSDLWTIHIRAPAGLLSPVLPRVLLCEVPMPVRPMSMQFLTCVQTGPYRVG